MTEQPPPLSPRCPGCWHPRGEHYSPRIESPEMGKTLVCRHYGCRCALTETIWRVMEYTRVHGISVGDDDG
jgi:hypothetical protein